MSFSAILVIFEHAGHWVLEALFFNMWSKRGFGSSGKEKCLSQHQALRAWSPTNWCNASWDLPNLQILKKQEASKFSSFFLLLGFCEYSAWTKFLHKSYLVNTWILSILYDRWLSGCWILNFFVKFECSKIDAVLMIDEEWISHIPIILADRRHVFEETYPTWLVRTAQVERSRLLCDHTLWSCCKFYVWYFITLAFVWLTV